MAGENDYLLFAQDNDANVMDQADYAALDQRGSGFLAGKAASEQLNKVWRQSSFVAHAIAQFIANQTDLDVLDDGDTDAFIEKFLLALVTAEDEVTRLTAPGPYAVLVSDRLIIVAQTISAPMTLNLPAVPGNAGAFSVVVLDGKGDSPLYPITINGNGNTINSKAFQVICNPYEGFEITWNGVEYNVKTVS